MELQSSSELRTPSLANDGSLTRRMIIGCFFWEEENVGFASCLLRDRAHDWWDKVGRAVRTATLAITTWVEFVTRFQREFVVTIKVQHLARDFHDFRQTIETVVEITTKYHEMALLVP